MTKEIIIGVLSAVLASVITWGLVGFKDSLSKIEVQKLASEIKTDEDFLKVLMREFLEDGRFKGKDGIDGKGGGPLVQNGNNSCMAMNNSQQICWGSEKLAIPSSASNFRGFSFTFAKEFKSSPVVTTGIHSNLPQTGDAFGVYKYSLNNVEYTGAIIEFSKGNSLSPVVMQYVAIGEI